MRLETLVACLPGACLAGDPAVEVTGITHDSRRVAPGDVFAALPGERAHGLDFIEQALERGAAAVLSDRRPTAPLPWIETPEPRRDAALAAWTLAGDPQLQLQLVGITGTNGKTTTAHLVAAMLEAAGHRLGLFGTLAYRLPGMEVPAPRTTPEATDLAHHLAELVAAGGDTAVMEVSSHGLAQHRVAGLAFAVAVLTNLSRDHLDFHTDMERYWQAKCLLFDRHLAPGGRRVLPADDPWAERLLAAPRGGDITWGIERGDVHASNLSLGLDGSRFTLHLGDDRLLVHLRLVGTHNLANALTAAAAAWAAGAPAAAIHLGLEAARPLPGRLEPVDAGLAFPVYVDYAHTPDGLRAVLESLRAVSERRLIVVFGAGGDRDRGKRGPMGDAVGRLADVAIVTSDNPRSENPAAIAEAVAAGVRAAGAEPRVVIDRRAAIATALELADEHSLVLVAGKGHERTQTAGGRTIPFSDPDVVLELAGSASCA